MLRTITLDGFKSIQRLSLGRGYLYRHPNILDCAMEAPSC
jgi:hypothetical protein